MTEDGYTFRVDLRLRPDPRATQVAIRSLSTEEAEAAPSLPTRIFYDYNMRDDPDWIERVVESLSDNVYLTIDVDGFDPAIMPATGTPEPGGLSWREALALLRAVSARRNIVGCDIVEVAPPYDNPGQVTALAAANIALELLALFAVSRRTETG